MRLLLLEDDPDLRAPYARRLRSEGHAVDEASTLDEARTALMDVDYDCLVFDRLVPDGDSLELLAEMWEQGERPPVLLLSALGDGDERVRGLQAGAADYVPKPVRLDELALRVSNLAVRATGGTTAPIRLGRVTIDRSRRHVEIEGRSIHLTRQQYSVLDYMVVNRHRLVTTEELLDHCWDSNRHLFANPLHSQITRLRSAFRGHIVFASVRGQGYEMRVISKDDGTTGSADGSSASEVS